MFRERISKEVTTVIRTLNRCVCHLSRACWLLTCPCAGLQAEELVAKLFPKKLVDLDAFLQVKMWIQLMIPKIEDGNNFGVSVQEDTVAELRTVEGEAASFLDQISRYYVSRAKLVAKVARYPHVEDYRRTVDELDEKEYLSLRIIVSELRNHYVLLHDVIIKNIEKIKKPRSANTDALY
uniref:Proteasome activator subunit 3 n=1 Tax=Eptatretus burgeri TaxID=7764 RepID=A0A8C4Q2P9_EPTBU